MPVIENLKTTKISLNQIISLVILIVACLIAITIHRKENEKVEQIRQIQQEQKRKNDILISVKDLRKRVEAYKHAFEPKDSRKIINTITNLAAATTGVEIVSLKPQKMSTGPDREGSKIYDKAFFHLAIKVEGYHQLATFISSLENNPIMFIIESLQVNDIQIARAVTGTKVVKLQVGLIISVISFKG